MALSPPHRASRAVNWSSEALLARQSVFIWAGWREHVGGGGPAAPGGGGGHAQAGNWWWWWW